MRISGKYKHNFIIEYELTAPEMKWADNNPTCTVTLKHNKKHLKTCRKGVKYTERYLKSMRRLGFTTTNGTIEVGDEQN